MRVNSALIFGSQEECERLQGKLYMLLSLAIKKSADSAYQSPHWDHQPTKEEERQEEIYIQDCKEASFEVERCAKEIYKLLTGKSI